MGGIEIIYIMRRENKYTSDAAREREQAHWFGRKGGNIPGKISDARDQRKFYRWCEAEATEDQLQSYILDESQPLVRRNFVAALLQCKKVQDFFDLTNQTQGLPKQSIELEAPPEITIEFDVD